MQQLLTIILPVYNREVLLKKTLMSLLALRGHGVDVILVDNGSKDESLKLCNGFAEKYERSDFDIKVVEELKPGACAARNRGLKMCTTPFVYFFDSDDFLTENFAQDVLQWLINDEKTDFFFVPVRMMRGSTGKVRNYIKRCSVDVQILSSMFCTSSMIFRTEFLRKIGGWNEDLDIWQDWELGIRVAAQHPRMKWCTKSAYHEILLHDDSITGKGFFERMEQTMKTMRVVQRECLGHEAALCMRALIVEKKLKREHCQEGALQYKNFACELLKELSCLDRIRVYLLRVYLKFNHRGAWRLGVIIV